MNSLQEKYSKIICALLNVVDIDYFNGDLGYGLSNYIAKFSLAKDYYYISNQALAIISNLYEERPNRLIRSAKQGEEFTYDHAIPVNIIKRELLSLPLKTLEEVQTILSLSDYVMIITKEENRLLNFSGLKENLPLGIQLRDNINPFVRYQEIQINYNTEETINMFGAIIR